MYARLVLLQVRALKSLMCGGSFAAAAILGSACGGSGDVGVEGLGSSPGADIELGTESVTTTSAAIPGADAGLKVSAVPEGWTFVWEERPQTERGNMVILQMFSGPEIEIDNPGGSSATLEVVVGATQIPDLVTSGRSEDLLALANVAGVDDWRVGDTLTVAGRPAVTLTRPVGPTVQREILTTIGDWRVHATGAAVDEETLLEFMEAVSLG